MQAEFILYIEGDDCNDLLVVIVANGNDDCNDDGDDDDDGVTATACLISLPPLLPLMLALLLPLPLPLLFQSFLRHNILDAGDDDSLVARINNNSGDGDNDGDGSSYPLCIMGLSLLFRIQSLTWSACSSFFSSSVLRKMELEPKDGGGGGIDIEDEDDEKECDDVLGNDLNNVLGRI